MDSREKQPCNSSNLLPDDLETVIPHDLVPSGYPGSETDKYFVRGYPHLLVRQPKGGYPIDKLKPVADAFNELPQYGINTLPYIPVEQDDETYIVTLNVTGKNLEDIIESGVDDEMVERIDTLWSNLATYLTTCKQQGKLCARDIFTPNQYMYGTVMGKDEPQLWLVDLGEWAQGFREDSPWDEYEKEVIELIDTVMSLESTLKRSLPNSRLALKRALDELD